MKISEFDYDLPPERIAQSPVEPRDSARLMVLQRSDGSIIHRTFRDIHEYLQPGDVLVLNESRVIPARLWGYKAETGGRVEILLLSRRDDNTWETLVRPGKRVQPGMQILFELEGTPVLRGDVVEHTAAGGRLIKFAALDTAVSTAELLERIGTMPLPPYIHAPLANPERYQTIYARTRGSVAAPTAGLHFTPELLAQLQSRGIEVTRVTLHIGLDTFRPIEADRVEEHRIHTEEIELRRESAEVLNRARADGRRIVAVGTTSVRVLESAAQRLSDPAAPLEPYTGPTSLYIYPGYQFRVVQAMITNFHLPRSSLLLLVSSFAGRESILHAYRVAIEEQYRFYSFGDAMLIL